jgi:hypothetical protein
MRSRVTVVLVVLSLFAVACSGDEGEPSPAPTDDPPVEDVPVEDDQSAIAFELFSSDEGAGCAVYVSVAEEEVSDDVRALIWQGVVTQEFTDCGFSDVVEVGLLTVQGLDSYNQPDFSQTIEHGYFAVANWEPLVADCYSTDLDDVCAATLRDAFTE